MKRTSFCTVLFYLEEAAAVCAQVLIYPGHTQSLKSTDPLKEADSYSIFSRLMRGASRDLKGLQIDELENNVKPSGNGCSVRDDGTPAKK